ncbi:hypothetical protein [Denitromonas iodatirespirans]|uniref:Uncharacterized protein n=1 Tax=Denitromonas iodatirespirans TaxID=2795389 RepID=A0A944D8Q7_DENI1|nr:hypothetical protein [Denitromonas iodatirespirans]MBT0960687.1 hypothetical protein [Denitromonas iodatirespirans]
MHQEKKKPKVVVGQHMLKLLNEKEQRAVAGGPRGPVRSPGNGCGNTGNGGNRCR